MSDQDTTADQPLHINGAIALVTDERDELVRLCVQTLAELLGSEPATDDDGDLNAQFADIADFDSDPVNDVRIDAVVFFPQQRLATEFQEDSIE